MDAIAGEDAGSVQPEDHASGGEREGGAGQEIGRSSGQGVGKAESGTQEFGAGDGGRVEEGAGGGEIGGARFGLVTRGHGQREEGTGGMIEGVRSVEGALESDFGAVFGMVVAAGVGQPAGSMAQLGDFGRFVREERRGPAPLGASLGDLLSQARTYGGLGFGTITTSVAFLGVIIALVTWVSITGFDRSRAIDAAERG